MLLTAPSFDENHLDSLNIASLSFTKADSEQSIPQRFETVLCAFSKRIAISISDAAFTNTKLTRRVDLFGLRSGSIHDGERHE